MHARAYDMHLISLLTHIFCGDMLVPTKGGNPGKDVHMSNRKNRMSKDKRRERRRREAEERRIYEDEGFTEDEIMFMSKKARKMLMEKYGRG